MKKLIFLFYSKADLVIFFNFIFNKIKNIFYKKKILEYKKNHKKLLLTKKITEDYFSSNAFNFYYFLKNLNDNFTYLEIGSFEGNSALFVSNNFKNSEINCVDCWFKTKEYSKELNFINVEENFNFNTINEKKIKKIKLTSDEFFNSNKKNFDVIYIDGDHYGPQVYKDCTNAIKILKRNGYLICDDYFWNFYSKNEKNPCFAINTFLRENRQILKIKKISNSQIFLQKI